MRAGQVPSFSATQDNTFAQEHSRPNNAEENATVAVDRKGTRNKLRAFNRKSFVENRTSDYRGLVKTGER
jgi:hypothetical protein